MVQYFYMNIEDIMMPEIRLTKQIFWHTITSILYHQYYMRRRGIVDNIRMPEREAVVGASYTEIIEPALEHCMKGVVNLPEMQRIPALTEEKRIAVYSN